MQTLTTKNPTTTQATNQSGFAAIPTRIHDLPASNAGTANASATNPSANVDPAVEAAVLSNLADLGVRLAAVHRTAAEAYLSQNRYAEALTHLEASTTFAPNQLEYLNQLGSVRYMNGDDRGAVGAFQRILEINPRQPDALFNLGMVRFGQNDVTGAEDCFRRSLEVVPENAEGWNNRGVCLFQLGRRDDARRCFEQALRIDATNADAIANLKDV